ncbi:MAG TPA: hypothetical protein VKZ50_18215 [bacterium]|nr:hypothetical protein [bacterium]
MRALAIAAAVLAVGSAIVPPSFGADLTVTLVSITPKVSHGQRSTLVIKTQPGVTCEGYISSGGKGGTELGHLPSRKANATGQITWMWPTAGKAGQRNAHVDCTSGSQTASVDAPFEVI